MIEQTDLVVTEWIYYPPANTDNIDKITSSISLDVMKKRNSIKKGIACRFSCRFMNNDETILNYVGEDSYVIDFADVIDKNELLKMIRNSYSKFKEKFDLRKLSTVLHDRSLNVFDETKIELDPILLLLK